MAAMTALLGGGLAVAAPAVHAAQPAPTWSNVTLSAPFDANGNEQGITLSLTEFPALGHTGAYKADMSGSYTVHFYYLCLYNGAITFGTDTTETIPVNPTVTTIPYTADRGSVTVSDATVQPAPWASINTAKLEYPGVCNSVLITYIFSESASQTATVADNHANTTTVTVTGQWQP